MVIPEYDLSILSDIAKHNKGRSKQELIRRYGKESSESVIFLQSNNLIQIHTANLRPFFPNNSDYQDPLVGNFIATSLGKTELKRWKTKHALTTKEKWKERFIGAIFTLSVWLIQELIKICI